MRNSKKNIKKISKKSRNKKMKAGREPTKIHILYVLGKKDGENQIQMITISKSIKNLHLLALDVPENLRFDKIDFQKIFDDNMFIDTIELDNANSSHSWQKVSFTEIHRLKETGEYGDNIDEFDEMSLYYVFDKKSTITGVIGAIYSNEVDSNDGVKTDNLDNAIELLDMYNPIDSELDVLENNLSIRNITVDAPRVQTDKEQKVVQTDKDVPAKGKSAVSPCPKDLLDSRYLSKNWSDVEEAGCSVKDLIDEGKIPYRFIHNTNGARRLIPHDSTFLNGLRRCRILNAINPQEVLNDGKWEFSLNDYKHCNEENKSRNLIKYLIENGITIPILLEKDYSVPYLLESGITLKEIIDSGVPIRSLIYTYGVNLSEIRNIGLSLEQLLNSGFTISELKDSFSIGEFKKIPIRLIELLKYFSLKELKPHYKLQDFRNNNFGFAYNTQIGNYEFKRLKEAFTIDELYKSGYTFAELYKMGATPAELATIQNVFGLGRLHSYIIDLKKLGAPDFMNPQLIKDNFSFDDIIYSLTMLKYTHNLKEILQLYPDALTLLKQNGKIKPKELLKDYGYKLEDLKDVYSEQELWDNGIRDFDALIKAGFYKPGLLAIKGIDIEQYTELNKKLFKQISLSELINKFPLSDTFHWIADGNISYISLRDLIVAYQNNIPELITVAKPEFLFATGLFTYGELKQWLKKDTTGKYNITFMELARDCKKNLFKRQTNLDCKYQPENFPNPNDVSWSKKIKGKAINNTVRYPEKEEKDKEKKK